MLRRPPRPDSATAFSRACDAGISTHDSPRWGKKPLLPSSSGLPRTGTVQQVSYGTGMGADLDHYRKIPLCPMSYGQALAVLLLTEGVARAR